MSDAKWDRIKALFAGASELPPAQRGAYLDRECAGDAGLRGEVESLLNTLEGGGRFLASPTNAAAQTVAAPTSATTMAPSGEAPGTRIGPYKLLQLIGEGGFGSVFMAEQERPVARKVALKIIKLGMDTRQVIARFEAERQALAMMDHPNIARVLDAGATELGRPYFVMDLVKGDPIEQYCDKNNLSIPERLELFAQVCQAVQHAHTKGVIHRDIKPSNILVATQDGRAVAKVIDFGIAKATNARLTEKTLFTEHRQLIGTPEYMSPEQAEGSLDIDTRTDVYSLGVLLYELLTGSTPFDSKSLRSAAYAEIQRIIREVEPPNPSTRLSQSGETIASVAAKRKTEPRKLGTMIRGELDWIVMKALEKDRSRRYESANGLAADIQRYLAGEAVVAAPPSRAYRLRKFVRRHKGPVAAGLLITLALVLGVIGTTVGLVRAQRAQRAEAAQREAAETARARAQTISDFVTTALQAGDAQNEGGGEDVTILAAMDNAIKDLDSGRFKGDPQTEAGLRTTIATILKNNGHPAQAEPLVVQALQTYRQLHPGDDPDVAAALNEVAEVYALLGRRDQAEPLMIQSLEMYERLYQGDNIHIMSLLNNIAELRESVGRAAEAEPLMVRSLEMSQRLYEGDQRLLAKQLDNLAKVREALGKYPEAEALYTRALDMRRRLYKGDHPDLAVGLNNLAGVRVGAGRAAEAEPLFVEALEMRRRLFKGDHPVVAEALNNLALARLAVGRPEEAEPLIAQGLEMNRRLFPGDHPGVAHSLYTLSSVRLDLGRFEDAEPLCLQSVQMHQRLFKGDYIGIAMSLVNLARAQQGLHKPADARRSFDEALAMLRRLTPEGSSPLLRALWRSGTARLDGNDAAAALPELEEAATMAEKLLPPGHKQIKDYRDTLARCRVMLGK